MYEAKTLLTGGEWDLLFLLHPTHLKVWLFHYRCEKSDHRESWPGESTICAMCQICRDTLHDSRKWLIDHGWLVRISRAYPGHNPTFRVERGWIPGVGCQRHKMPEADCLACQAHTSKRVEVMRRKDSDASANPPLTDAFALNASDEKRRKKADADVCLCSCGSGSGCTCRNTYTYREQVASLENPSPATPGEEPENPNPNQNQPVPDSESKAKPSRPRKSKAAPDGTEYPSEFDSWSNVARTEWLVAHGLPSEPKEGSVQGSSAKPPSTPSSAAPSPAKQSTAKSHTSKEPLRYESPLCKKCGDPMLDGSSCRKCSPTIKDRLAAMPKLQPEPEPEPERHWMDELDSCAFCDRYPCICSKAVAAALPPSRDLFDPECEEL
jgi:hypothetical protein